MCVCAFIIPGYVFYNKMNYFKPASTLYHGMNSGSSNDEDNTLSEIISASADEQLDETTVEGRVTYISPVSTFEYNTGEDGHGRKTKKGMVQSYTILDLLAQKNKKPIYTYRVTAWNEQVSNHMLKKDEYYRLSNFAWKENTFPKRPDHQSRYDVHLKRNSMIEHIPHIPHLIM